MSRRELVVLLLKSFWGRPCELSAPDPAAPWRAVRHSLLRCHFGSGTVRAGALVAAPGDGNQVNLLPLVQSSPNLGLRRRAV